MRRKRISSGETFCCMTTIKKRKRRPLRRSRKRFISKSWVKCSWRINKSKRGSRHKKFQKAKRPRI